MDRQGFSYFRVILAIWLSGFYFNVKGQELVPNGYFNYRNLVLNNRKLAISEMGNTLVEDLDKVAFATHSVAFLK